MDGKELVAAYFDNTLSDADAARLAAWVEASAANARFFAEWSVLENHIDEQVHAAEVLRADKLLRERALAHPSATPAPAHAGAAGSVRRLGVPLWALAAASVALIATLAIMYSQPFGQTPPSRSAQRPTPDTPAPPAAAPFVATLIEQRGAVWAPPAGQADAGPLPGERLRAAPARLVAGVAELRTDTGTTLYIEGPASFTLESADTLRLESGRVYGDTSTTVGVFSVLTPRVELNGCDQTFAAGVDAAGNTRCQVYAGSADARVLDGAGQVEHVSRLLPNQSLTVDATGRVRVGRADPAEFVRTLQPSELEVGRDYVRAVLASAPTDYWRFEEVQGGDLFNEMPGRPNLRIQSVGRGLVLSDDIQNRHLHRTKVTGEFLVSTETLTIDSNRYSFECWVRNDHTDAWTTLFALEVQPELRAVTSYGMLQLDLMPAGEDDAQGGHRLMVTHTDAPVTTEPDLYSPPDPGAERWHHIVLVRDGSYLALYRDGERWLEGRVRRAGYVEDVTLVLGRNGTRPGGNIRLFRGSLDEVALYDRALTDTEVREHYRAVRHLPGVEGGL